MKRIAIVGPVASGKTTLAGQLASIFELPAVDLDDYYWRRNPIPTSDQWTAIHRDLIAKDRWIISGDYRAAADARFLAAELVVWLDLGRLTVSPAPPCGN